MKKVIENNFSNKTNVENEKRTKIVRPHSMSNVSDIPESQRMAHMSLEMYAAIKQNEINNARYNEIMDELEDRLVIEDTDDDMKAVGHKRDEYNMPKNIYTNVYNEGYSKKFHDFCKQKNIPDPLYNKSLTEKLDPSKRQIGGRVTLRNLVLNNLYRGGRYDPKVAETGQPSLQRSEWYLLCPQKIVPDNVWFVENQGKYRLTHDSGARTRKYRYIDINDFEDLQRNPDQIIVLLYDGSTPQSKYDDPVNQSIINKNAEVLKCVCDTLKLDWGTAKIPYSMWDKKLFGITRTYAYVEIPYKYADELADEYLNDKGITYPIKNPKRNKETAPVVNDKEQSTNVTDAEQETTESLKESYIINEDADTEILIVASQSYPVDFKDGMTVAEVIDRLSKFDKTKIVTIMNDGGNLTKIQEIKEF